MLQAHAHAVQITHSVMERALWHIRQAMHVVRAIGLSE